MRDEGASAFSVLLNIVLGGIDHAAFAVLHGTRRRCQRSDSNICNAHVPDISFKDGTINTKRKVILVSPVSETECYSHKQKH